MAKADLKVKFGLRVRSLREAQHLTQDELAERIGRSVDTVSNIERGIYSTRIEVVGRIAEVMGVSLADLFDFGDNDSSVANREQRRVVQSLTAALNDLDSKNLIVVRDVIEACVKLAKGRRGRSHR